jgi:hypothetical protein
MVKQLKGVITQEPFVNPVDPPVDQYKDFMDSIGAITAISPQEYQAHEFVHAKIQVNAQYFSFIDFTAPVVNFRNVSIHGIATFSTVIPYPIDETYVHKPVGFSNKLVPYRLAIERRMKPKRIIKEGMIVSKAVTAINNDKKL